MTVRPAIVEDVPWLVETATTAYAGLVEGFDRNGAERWIRACIADPDTVVMRGDTTAGFAQIVRCPWSPAFIEMDLIHLFGQADGSLPWEACKVVAALNDVRKERGCDKMYVGSIFADLEPIARRLGGRRLGSLYALED